MAKRSFVVMLALLLGFAFSGVLPAQESAVKGSIDGLVVDASGASVPNAMV